MSAEDIKIKDTSPQGPESLRGSDALVPLSDVAETLPPPLCLLE